MVRSGEPITLVVGVLSKTLINIDVVAVQSPHQAAQVLGGDYDPKLPDELLLGIDDSPVL
jgi:hypothetical protein